MNRSQSEYRVLAIDDNKSILSDFAKVLKPKHQDDSLDQAAAAFLGRPVETVVSQAALGPNYDITPVMQGQDGVAQARKALEEGKPFAVALVDMRMPPGWDGLKTIEELWKIDDRIQTVICSAYSDYSRAQIIERLGDNDRLLILRKPFDPIELIQVVSALTAKWDQDQQIQNHIDHLEEKVAQRTQVLEAINHQLQDEILRRVTAESGLRRAALHDALTDLPNRIQLMDRMEYFAKRASTKHGEAYAVLAMDLNRFKQVNDELGHASGDQLLVGVAQRLLHAASQVEMHPDVREVLVARLGGDEFVMVLDGVITQQIAMDAANEIQSALQDSFVIAGREIIAATSIGIAIGERDQDKPQSLLRDADAALYDAKKQERWHISIFDEALRHDEDQRRTLEKEIKDVRFDDELCLAYQPIVSLESGRIIGAEALLRWRHQVLGDVPPRRFIPVAESLGLMPKIGAWVFKSACETVSDWTKRFDPYQNMFVNINLSPRQIGDSGLVAVIEQVLADTGLPAEKVHLDLTEKAIFGGHENTIKRLETLAETGVTLCLDDFGIGASSLTTFERMPVGVLKLDCDFVQAIKENGRQANVTQALVTMAANRQIKVLAEGVETLEQLVQLQTVDCQLGQGFYFSPPVSAQEFERLLMGQVNWKRLAA